MHAQRLAQLLLQLHPKAVRVAAAECAFAQVFAAWSHKTTLLHRVAVVAAKMSHMHAWQLPCFDGSPTAQSHHKTPETLGCNSCCWHLCLLALLCLARSAHALPLRRQHHELLSGALTSCRFRCLSNASCLSIVYMP